MSSRGLLRLHRGIKKKEERVESGYKSRIYTTVRKGRGDTRI